MKYYFRISLRSRCLCWGLNIGLLVYLVWNFVVKNDLSTLEQRFVKWACDDLTENVDFGKKIIF